LPQAPLTSHNFSQVCFAVNILLILLSQARNSGPARGGHTSNGSEQARPKYDVKGKAKGQGQTTEVLRNRQFKSQHKARGANHNRKAGAMRKAAKGMF